MDKISFILQMISLRLTVGQVPGFTEQKHRSPGETEDALMSKPLGCLLCFPLANMLPVLKML